MGRFVNRLLTKYLAARTPRPPTFGDPVVGNLGDMDSDTARQRVLAERDRLERLRRDESAELDDAEPDETGEYERHPVEGAQMSSIREMDASVVGSLEQELADVERALERIDDGTYERCEVCGQPIGDDRLEARPTARFCIDHQEQAENQTRAARWNP